MRFTKMQGIGNDYVYVNCFEEHVENPSELAKQMSRRHYGVGSDGLILICPSDVADFEMKMYNADGSNDRPARTMGFLSKKVRFFLISLLTTFPVCGMIQTVGNVRYASI